MVLELESAMFEQDQLISYGWKDLQQPRGRGEVLNPQNYYGSSMPENVKGGSGYCPAGKRGRRKRRRTGKMVKNIEEIEKQRMIHIAVERNRRKQMNEYLSILKSIAPSYTQKGDQASIVGGTINFVKELQQAVQCLEAEKHNNLFSSHDYYSVNSTAAANVEVTVIESYANIKMMAENRPKQLLKLVLHFHSLNLFILHVNVTTICEKLLYCFSVKMQDDCKLSTVSEITAAVNEMLERIPMEQV